MKYIKYTIVLTTIIIASCLNLQAQTLEPYHNFGKKNILSDSIPISYVDDSGRVAVLERVPNGAAYVHKKYRFVAHYFNGTAWKHSDTFEIYRKTKAWWGQYRGLGATEVTCHKGKVYVSICADSTKGNLDTNMVKWDGTSWSSVGNGLEVLHASLDYQSMEKKIKQLWLNDTLIIFAGTTCFIKKAGGISVANMAKLNPSTNQWEAFGTGANNGFNNTFKAENLMICGAKDVGNDTLVFTMRWPDIDFLGYTYAGTEAISYLVYNYKVVDSLVHKYDVVAKYGYAPYIGMLYGKRTWLNDTVLTTRVAQKTNIQKIQSFFSSSFLFYEHSYNDGGRQIRELGNGKAIFIPNIPWNGRELAVYLIEPNKLTRIALYNFKDTLKVNNYGFRGSFYKEKFVFVSHMDSMAQYDFLTNKFLNYKVADNVMALNFSVPSQITGNVFHDRNSDSILNGSDTGISQILVLAKGNRHNNYTLANDTGYFELSTFGTDTFTFSAFRIDRLRKLFGQYYLDTLKITKDTVGAKIQIPMFTTNYTDIELFLTKSNYGRLRRGDTVEITLEVRNNCLKNYSNVELVLGVDPKLTNFSSSASFSAIIGKPALRKLTVSSLPALANVEVKFKVYVNADSNQSGEHRNVWAYLENHTDTFNSNNEDTMFGFVVAAYDPNMKQSNPSGEVKHPVSKIRYFVQFQNLGNSYAKNVVVRDTLDMRFPIEKLYLTGSKHKYNIKVEEGNVLVFTFNDIYLKPASENVESSIGWFAYDLNLNRDLQVGDSIRNRVGIYFDYEKPVVTSYAVVKVVKADSVIVGAQYVKMNGELKVMPNPVEDQLTIQFGNKLPLSVSIMDIHGRLMSRLAVDSTDITMSLKELKSGIYFIKTSDGRCIKIFKL